MTLRAITLVLLAHFLFFSALGADESAELLRLKEQLKQMQEALDAQQRQMEMMRQQIERLEQARPAPAQTNAVLPAPSDAAASTHPHPAATGRVSAPWSATNSLRLFGNRQNYLNVSFDGLFAAGSSTASDLERLQPGAHDPAQRGFTVQNLEMTFEGAVDPYFTAQANIIYQLDRDGESILEIEEAFMQTVSLPLNLQLKAGQFFTEFGRHNPFHPHSWSFVDAPLVNASFLGPDGLRNPGARLSWLAPTPFYSEFLFAVQNSHGETAASFRSDHEEEPFLGRLQEVNEIDNLGDLLFVPRYAASVDLSDTQTLLVGTSAAFGPNASGDDTDTQIFGVDAFWKWKSASHQAGFPFVSWQTEAMLRRYEAGAFDWDLNGNGILDPDEQDLDSNGVPDFLPRETLEDWGIYSQVVYGFRKGWTAGIRGDSSLLSRAAITKEASATTRTVPRAGAFPQILPGIRPSSPSSACSTIMMTGKISARTIPFGSNSNFCWEPTPRTGFDP